MRYPDDRARLLIRLPSRPERLAGEEGFDPCPATSKQRTGIGKKILLFLSNPPHDIISTSHPEINYSPLHYFRHITICLLDCDFHHITKHLTDLGVYAHTLSCYRADNVYRHGVPPESPAEGKVISVRTERARELPWGGDKPC